MLDTLTGALGGALGQVGDVLSKPRQWAWQMIPGLHDDEGAAYTGSQVVHNLTGLDEGSPWAKALGLGAEVLGDPLTYAGAGLGRLGKLAGLGGEAAEGASQYSKLKGLRDQFALVKNVQRVPEEMVGAARAAEAAGELPGRSLLSAGAEPYMGIATGPIGDRALAARTLDRVGPRFDQGVSYGSALEGGGMSFLPPGAGPGIRRHETIHALIDAARQSGDYGALPSLPMRVAARMQDSGLPFVRGLGGIADEAIAHGAESRGALGQALGAGRFLLGAHPGYAEQFAQVSPLAAALYGNSRTALGVGGVGLLGSAGIGYLNQ